MNEKYMKSWFWQRELDRDELIKRKIAEGLPEAEAVSLVRPCSRRLKTISTRLYWWRSADHFDISFGIDGGEPGFSFCFMIPWLFGLSIQIDCNWDWFKRKYPKIMDTDASKEWRLTGCREFGVFKWASLEDYMGSSQTREGTYKTWDWVDVFKGKNTSVEWGKAELVYEREHSLRVVYRSSRHPTVPFYQATKIRAYKKVGTWRFSRWFPKRRTRWEIECDQVFTMPGKGENSWDCEDWDWGGYSFDAERQSCDFSTGAKTVDDAVASYIESFNKTQRQG